jgi:thioesterase domain-containing protein
MTRLMRAAVIVARKTLSFMRYQRSSRIAQAKLDAELLSLQTALDKGERPPSGTLKLTVRQIVSHAQWATRVHGRLVGDVLLLRAKNGDGTQADQPFFEIFEDPLFGWGEVVEGNVVIADVDGGHASMLQEPFVASTQAALQAYIDKALTTTTQDHKLTLVGRANSQASATQLSQHKPQGLAQT